MKITVVKTSLLLLIALLTQGTTLPAPDSQAASGSGVSQANTLCLPGVYSEILLLLTCRRWR
jgi:hypothetical protein